MRTANWRNEARVSREGATKRRQASKTHPDPTRPGVRGDAMELVANHDGADDHGRREFVHELERCTHVNEQVKAISRMTANSQHRNHLDARS